MRLYHVSETPNIKIFKPRFPTRPDLDQDKGLVWAITEACLPNFLTPRDCPRVAYYATDQTSQADMEAYFSKQTSPYVVAIENAWFETMKKTTLYLYEFDPKDFVLQDEVAGYYISESPQTPIGVAVVTDLFDELFKRQVEVRLLPDLIDLSQRVKASTLNWSLCRMVHAKQPL